MWSSLHPEGVIKDGPFVGVSLSLVVVEVEVELVFVLVVNVVGPFVVDVEVLLVVVELWLAVTLGVGHTAAFWPLSRIFTRASVPPIAVSG